MEDRAAAAPASGRAAWTDRDGRPVPAPEPPADGAFYDPVGDFQGAAYERNAFTKGTAQEAAFLWEALGLQDGTVVVDVGCGTGRHARALAARGARVVGVDRSAGLLAAAAAAGPAAPLGTGPGVPASGTSARRPAVRGVSAGGARYVRADARALPLRTGAADAVICLCQGGFGITPGGDERILAEMARVLRPGGRLALTAFSLVFAARWLAPEDGLDAARGLVWSPAEVRGADDARRHFDLWTSCYSAGHLEKLVASVGLDLVGLSGVEPGQFGHAAPTILHPELLVLATKP